MHPREVEQLAKSAQEPAREFAIGLASRMGADAKHLAVARSLRGSSKAPIVAYLTKSGLQRSATPGDKAAKLAILAGGSPYKPAYVRAICEHAQRLGVSYADIVPSPPEPEGPDPGSRGEKALERARQAEKVSADHSAKLKLKAEELSAKASGEGSSEDHETPAASADVPSTPEPQGV